MTPVVASATGANLSIRSPADEHLDYLHVSLIGISWCTRNQVRSGWHYWIISKHTKLIPKCWFVFPPTCGPTAPYANRVKLLPILFANELSWSLKLSHKCFARADVDYDSQPHLCLPRARITDLSHRTQSRLNLGWDTPSPPGRPVTVWRTHNLRHHPVHNHNTKPLL
jgi:hypothetical protein